MEEHWRSFCSESLISKVFKYYSLLGILAVHEACEQEGSEGLLRSDQAAHGPGDHEPQDQDQERMELFN